MNPNKPHNNIYQSGKQKPEHLQIDSLLLVSKSAKTRPEPTG